MYFTKPARAPRAHHPIRRVALVLSLAWVGCATQSPSQSAAPPAPTAAVQPPLCPPASAPSRELASKPGYVQLTVYVTDPSDKPVAGLKQSDFTASASNKQLPIEFFHDNQNGVPLSLALALDTSGSMLDKLGIADPSNVEDLWNGLAALMVLLNECDEVAALQFGGRRPPGQGYEGSHDNVSSQGDTEVKLLEPLTTDHEFALSSLSYAVPFGKTPLYDAIHESLQTLAAAHYPDRALIVITDGMDTASTTTAQAALDEAAQSRVAIYAIGVGMPHTPAPVLSVVGTLNEHVDVKTLEDLSRPTNGRTFIAPPFWTDGAAAFIGALTSVGVILGQSYSIGVVMPARNSGGGEQPIIRVPSHPEALVQAHRVVPN